jgi:protein-S-isoprenylcysteine O-methyltransferase Ste14
MARRRTKLPIRRVKSVPLPPPVAPLDRVARWLHAWPRPLRMLLAAIIAAIVTGVVGLALFSLVFSLPPSQIPPDIVTWLLVGLSVLGFALYWVGWVVFLGFGWGETPHRVGRAAVLWIMFGMLVLIVASVIGVIAAIDATREI